MTFSLSQDQITAIQGICDTLLDTNPAEYALAVLTGSAGVGKTTVVGEIIRNAQMNNHNQNIQLCATTHRAASVLSDIVGYEVETGHAAFKLRPSVTRYGKEVLKSAGTCDIPYGSLVIMDEASMIGNQFLKAIVKTVQERALKLLFVGDLYQLPPPGDACSIFDGSLPTFTLTTVHRQNAGNPILDKAIEYRDYISGARTDEPILDTSINDIGEGIHVLPHADFVSQFVKKYLNYETGTVVDIPLCTFTNESAINYNTMVRKAAYFLEDKVAPFYKEERLIANSIVKNGDRTVLTNNEVVIVKDFKEHEYKGIQGHMVTVQGDTNKHTKTNIKRVFVPITKAAADATLNVLKKEALRASSKHAWVDFYDVKNQLADLRPPFAGTTHKAQGGTFPAVFIDRTNINKCREPATRARLMYVALTRASKNVYINN
jgi:exodeoxyribonuclease V